MHFENRLRCSQPHSVTPVTEGFANEGRKFARTGNSTPQSAKLAVVKALQSITLFALLFAAQAAAAAPEMYRYDTTHSQVLFSVDHNGFSKPVGRLHIAGGWLRVDTNHLADSATELDIDLNSVDMGDADWNKAVRGDTLLDADDNRYAHFVSTSVKVTGARQGILHGKLTLRGHTVPVNVAFTLNRHGVTVFDMHDTIGFSAKAHLDRRAFGMISNPGSIGHKVTVRLEIEAQQNPEARRDYMARHGAVPASSVDAVAH